MNTTADFSAVFSLNTASQNCNKIFEKNLLLYRLNLSNILRKKWNKFHNKKLPQNFKIIVKFLFSLTKNARFWAFFSLFLHILSVLWGPKRLASPLPNSIKYKLGTIFILNTSRNRLRRLLTATFHYAGLSPESCPPSKIVSLFNTVFYLTIAQQLLL